MNEHDNNIEFLANIKEIKIRTLVSGDKEVRLSLSIVGQDINEANKLAYLPVDKQVKIEANWDN